MKSISLGAAAACLLTAASAQFEVGLYSGSTCSGSPAHTQDVTSSAHGGFGNGECRSLESSANSIAITTCVGHTTCECDLHTSRDCSGQSIVINYDPRKSDQFCFLSNQSIQSMLCYFL